MSTGEQLRCNFSDLPSLSRAVYHFSEHDVKAVTDPFAVQDVPLPRAQLLGLPSFKTLPSSSAYQKEGVVPRTSPSRPRPVGQPSAATQTTSRQTVAPKGILRSSPGVNNDAHLDYLDVELRRGR